jgi:hypothetical protein
MASSQMKGPTERGPTYKRTPSFVCESIAAIEPRQTSASSFSSSYRLLPHPYQAPGSRCSSLATGANWRLRSIYYVQETRGVSGIMLQKFQAEVRQTPAVTILHTLNCPNCSGTYGPARIVRARNVSEATLELIATYMSNDVRRAVTACRCTRVPLKAPSGFWSRLRSA